MLKGILVLVLLFTFPFYHIEAQRHSEEEEHHSGLHFSHPLFTESISPDTKLRFDYQYSKINDLRKSDELHLEYEYAFYRYFSVSLTTPYVFISQKNLDGFSNFGDVELSFKFANYAFEKNNILLGYGLSLGFPTGNDSKGIGSSYITNLEPFFNVGYLINDFEFTIFSTFGIPMNLHQSEAVENDFNLQFSTIYNITDWFQTVLEINRESVINGNMDEGASWYIAPGVKAIPFDNFEKLVIGFGIRVPLSDTREMDTQLLMATFYHF